MQCRLLYVLNDHERTRIVYKLECRTAHSGDYTVWCVFLICTTIRDKPSPFKWHHFIGFGFTQEMISNTSRKGRIDKFDNKMFHTAYIARNPVHLSRGLWSCGTIYLILNKIFKDLNYYYY